MIIKSINPNKFVDFSTQISQGLLVKGSKMLVVSGQVALNKEGKVEGKGSIKRQMEVIMERLGYILEEAGGNFSHVIKVTMFLTDINKLPEAIEVRSKYLKENKPAATAVEVSALVKPDLLIEVEIMAVLD